MYRRILNSGVFMAILGFIVLGTWSMASPVGSAADDNFHLASIWCGTFSEECKEDNGNFLVPAETLSGMCNIIWIDRNLDKYNQNARCTTEKTKIYQETDYINQKNVIYPSLFYNISSIFVSENVQTSVVKIRIFWSVFFLFLTTLIFVNSDKQIKSAIMIILILFGIPLMSFLIASTNPSSLQITSIGLLPFAMTSLLRKNLKSENRAIMFCLTLFLIVTAVGSKPESFIYVAAVIVSAMILNKDSIEIKKWAIPSILVFILSVYAFKVITMLQEVQKVVTNSAIPLFPFQWKLLVSNLVNFHEFLAGFWGFYWGLGWKFEPPLNNWLAYFQFITCFLVLIIAFSRIKVVVDRIVLTFLIIMMISVPIATLQKGYFKVGDIVQPRYLLPFGIAVSAIVIIAALKNIETDSKNISLFRIFLGGAALLSVASGINSMWLILVRNVNGLKSNSIRLNGDSWWWNNLFISPSATFYIHTVSLLLFAIISLLRLDIFLNVKSKNEVLK